MTKEQEKVLEQYVLKDGERKAEFQAVERHSRLHDNLRSECEKLEKTIKGYVGANIPVKYVTVHGKHLRITEKGIEVMDFETFQ